MSGIYCNKVNDRVPVKYWTEYCKISYEKCPYYDERNAVSKNETQTKPAPSSDHNDYTSSSSYSGGGSSSSGGSSSLGLLDVLGAFKSAFVIFLIAAVVGLPLYGIGYMFGYFKNGVVLDLPAEADTSSMEMYSVSHKAKRGFKTRTDTFDENNRCVLDVLNGMNDVYLEEDGISVWLGTTYSEDGYDAVVNDITYEEILSQQVRVLLMELSDTNLVPLSAPKITVTDETGAVLPCFYMNDGRYALKFPNAAASSTLLITVDGYEPYTASVDLTARLSSIRISLVETGGAAQ